MFNDFLSNLLLHFEHYIGSTEKLAVLWEASKAYIRGKCSAQIKVVKTKICLLEKRLSKIIFRNKYQDLGKRKIQLHKIHNKKVEYVLFRIRTNYNEGWEKGDKLLARQLKQQDACNIITATRNN